MSTKASKVPTAGPNMAPLLAAQPLKAIYTTYILLTVPVRAIYLYPKYLVKPLYPGWTASMSLISSLLDLFFHYCTVTRSRHVLEYVTVTMSHVLFAGALPSGELVTSISHPAAARSLMRVACLISYQHKFMSPLLHSARFQVIKCASLFRVLHISI